MRWQSCPQEKLRMKQRCKIKVSMYENKTLGLLICNPRVLYFVQKNKIIYKKYLQKEKNCDNIHFVVKTICRRVGMADEADSKSVVGNNVRVQVPLPAVNP